MKLYNTMSRRLEEFTPSGDDVKIYVCGITPYDHSHLGHAMSYIIFDVIRRYLEFRGFKTKHVQNYTDIDDRIITRANSLGQPFDQVAATYIEEYEQEMHELNITPAHIFPRATHEDPDDHRDDGASDRAWARLRGGRGRLLPRPQQGGLRQALWPRRGFVAGGRARRTRASRRRTRRTSRSGRPRSPANRRGIAPGARAARAGTSSARRCRTATSAQRSTFTAAVRT